MGKIQKIKIQFNTKRFYEDFACINDILFRNLGVTIKPVEPKMVGDKLIFPENLTLNCTGEFRGAIFQELENRPTAPNPEDTIS